MADSAPVKGLRRVDGVLWRHRSHVATRRSHMRQSNMAKQFLPVMHNCCTVDRQLECETRILNHEHVCSLSLFSRNSQQQWTRHTRVRHGRALCVLNFFVRIHESFSRRIFCVVSTLLTQFSAMAALCRTSDPTPSLTI